MQSCLDNRNVEFVTNICWVYHKYPLWSNLLMYLLILLFNFISLRLKFTVNKINIFVHVYCRPYITVSGNKVRVCYHLCIRHATERAFVLHILSEIARCYFASGSSSQGHPQLRGVIVMTVTQEGLK